MGLNCLHSQIKNDRIAFLCLHFCSSNLLGNRPVALVLLSTDIILLQVPVCTYYGRIKEPKQK